MLYSLAPNGACLCVSYEIPRSQVPHCTDCTGTMTADAWLRDSNLFSDVLSLVLKTWINRDVENILSQNFKPFSSHVLEIYILIKCTSEQACYLSLILIRWKQKLLMSLITWNGHMYACMQWCLLTSYSSWGQRLENHQFPTWFDLWKKKFAHRMHGKRKRCYQLENGDDPAIHRMGSAPKLWPLTAAWTHFWVAPICEIYGRFLAPNKKHPMEISNKNQGGGGEIWLWPKCPSISFWPPHHHPVTFPRPLCGSMLELHDSTHTGAQVT